ncbi:CHAT domain-containing protein [Nostocaceae cyanobacterium CENA369]|uniref:CHAT domain-containing protein n=1 Tax=Dendronalium phyllosphericum CENA369 TaxID=1725256 RepID=A0A8J7I844_9NOST|nr:CHAT domain-containing protein [Dendronalium phyllosphericum]MBH8577905.1 CHAT domain-containing protein [Dendronalium phyllosphericum CENA369]
MKKELGNVNYKLDEQQDKNYLEFLVNLLNVSLSNDQKNIELLLAGNLDKLNNYFAQLVSKLITDLVSKAEPSQALLTLASVPIFSEILYAFANGSLTNNQDIAINACECVIKILKSDFFSTETEFILKNLTAPTQAILANAYLDRINGERAENLEKVIYYAENALKGYKYENVPQAWASTHFTLSIAYGQRIHGSKSENIEKSIISSKNALLVYSYEVFPTDWAKLQNNLALAYYQRIEGDKTENLELAINYCKNALLVHTRDNYLQGWAKTTINIANAYRDRKQGEVVDNIEQAIAYYQEVLDYINPKIFPEEWAKAQVNLGTTYRQKNKLNKSDGEVLEQAIDYHIKAIRFFNPETFDEIFEIPQPLIEAVSNAILTDEEWETCIDDTQVENLLIAIKCYEQALQVSSHEIFPEQWAGIYISLGRAYKERQQILEAVKSFQSALEFYKPITFTQESLKIGRILGNLAFCHGLWLEAIQGYTSAINALEQLRISVICESHRQKIVEIFLGLYQNMVQACINAGQIEKAFEYSERSRSKRLVDLMASYNLFQGEEIHPKVQELLQQYEELQQQIDRERQRHKSEKNRSETRAVWEAYNEAIASLEAQKQQVWENLRREDPVLAGEIQVNSLSLSEIQKLLINQPNTAILSFYTTNSDTHIFVAQQSKITVHTCTGQGLDTLQGWINQNWLLPYMQDFKKWETQINNILRELAERLQIPELISQHLEAIEELILVPHLLLHQMPFTALPTGEYQEYLGDKYLIRYTPSCQILEFCQQRDTVGTFNEVSLQYGIVEDAEDNLPCARFEGEKLAQMYNIPTENRLIGSSQATCKNYRHLAQQVQVLHSSHHAVSRLDNPLESQLKLADGNITLGQLMTPSWRLPQLVEVFLSCCETNLGTPSLTDDILTLSTGFLCAGARSVVSTLWSVNDLATALFSIFYYQERQEGKNRPKALKQAQIKLRELRKEEFLRCEDIKKLYNHAKTEFEEAQNKRSQYERGSAERLKWTQKYINYQKLKNQIEVIENSKKQFPFSHPRYWAAFICQGLR